MIIILGKVSLVLALALLATLPLRRRSAALRHWVLAVGVVAAAATPVIAMVLPAWHIGRAAFEVAPARAESAPAAGVATSITVETEPAGYSSPARPADPPVISHRLSPTRVIVNLWLAGSSVALALLIVGFVRLRWLTRDARLITSGPWFETASRVRDLIGVSREVVLLQSSHPTLLATWGWTRPRVVLPATAATWSNERIRIVLGHELAHVRRRDWIVQIASELLRAVYWFNPLAWLAVARLRHESECACDDVVLGSGTDAHAYASHLVDVARALDNARQPWLPVPTMARRSSLEGRVTAMLNPAVNRTAPAAWSRVAATLMLLGASASIAAMAPQRSFSTLSGTVVDQTNRGIPDVPVTVTDTAKREKREVRTDLAGHYELVGLVPGDYVLSVEQPGFTRFSESVPIGSDDARRDVQLELASLQETITIRNGQTPPVIAAPDVQARRRESAARYRQAVDRCGAGAPNETGGNILAPRKLVDVKPIYPEALIGAKIGGTVTMDAAIGTDGSVTDVRAVSSPDPQLEQAAIVAVRQWQFSSTLLNCTPVEVRMHVTATFVPQP